MEEIAAVQKNREKANVLVMGNSGAGKSTLINAIFKKDMAQSGSGPSVTKEMAIYQSDHLPFRAIDTRGLEYGFFSQMQTKNAIRKWSKNSVKEGKPEKYIHVIWYCVEATSKRVFAKNLDTLREVSGMWKQIPIIIVLTKSYSGPEIDDNVRMIRYALDRYNKKDKLNVIDVIPVVALPFPISNDIIVPPMGLELLTQRTNEIMPEALRLNQEAVAVFEGRIRRNSANAVVAAATTGAAAVGAIPIPIADSAVLIPLQSGLVMQLIKMYGIKKDESWVKQVKDTILTSGLVSIGAKGVISAVKAIPGLNIAAALLNAIVAGVITAVLGEVTIYLMEQVEKGEVDPDDLDWMSKAAESEFMKRIGKYTDTVLAGTPLKNAGDIGKLISGIFKERNQNEADH